MPRATPTPRALSPKQRYNLFRLRTPNPLARQRKAYTHIYKTLAPQNRESHFQKIRKEAAEKEIEKGRPLLKRYVFLTVEERKVVDERVREVRRKGGEDAGIVDLLAARGEGQRVVVAMAPKGGMKGRIGVVRGIDAMGVARVGELEEGEEHLIPLTHLLPIRRLNNQDTIITPNNPARTFLRTQRKEVGKQFAHLSRVRANRGIFLPNPRQQYDTDTLPNVVAQSSWKPDLLRPPIPESIIDELRGKYSSDRTRWIDKESGQSQPPEWWQQWRETKAGRRAARPKIDEANEEEEVEDDWMDLGDGYEGREVPDSNIQTSSQPTTATEPPPRMNRREAKRLERESLLRIGNVMAELSLKEQKERERADRDVDAPSKEMPSEEVLELLGRAMARAGVAVPPTASSPTISPYSLSATHPSISTTTTPPLKGTTNKSVLYLERNLQSNNTLKTPAVKAREADAIVRRSRKEAREQSAMYWPVKGWKEKQRLQARQGISLQEAERKRKELVKGLVPRSGGARRQEAQA